METISKCQRLSKKIKDLLRQRMQYGFSFIYKTICLLSCYTFFFSCAGKEKKVVKYYDANQKFLRATYTVKSGNPELIEGVYKEYYPNGRLKNELEYKSGRLWNVVSQFDSSGNRLTQSRISNGKGMFVVYSENGNPLVEVEMEEGLPSGEVRYLSTNRRYRWTNGLPDPDETSNNTDLPSFETQTSSPQDSLKAAQSGFNISIADAIVKDLQEGKIKDVYSKSYSKLKEVQSYSQFEKYWNFLTKIYGRLKSYKRISYQLSGMDTAGEGLEVVYECQFSLVKGALYMTFISENARPALAGMMIRAEDYAPIVEINNMGKVYMELIKAGDYEKIYARSSARFKEISPRSAFDDMSRKLKELGMLTSFQLYQHQVGLLEGQLVVAMVYEATFGGKEFFVEVSVGESESGFVLEGLNLSPQDAN